MTRFADLRLCAPLRNIDQLENMIAKSAELGYHLVAIPFPISVKQEEIKKVKRICADFALDLSTRVDLSPKDPHELLRSLGSVRRRFEIVSVSCASKPVARQAAKDRRVDLLTFPVTETHKTFFDMAEVELAKKSLSFLEIEIAQILLLEGTARIRLISIINKEAHIAEHFHIPFILSSGATNALLLRKPRDVASLATLFDIDVTLALRAISEIPIYLVNRNRLKLKPEFVAPGISLIERRTQDV